MQLGTRDYSEIPARATKHSQRVTNKQDARPFFFLKQKLENEAFI